MRESDYGETDVICVVCDQGQYEIGEDGDGVWRVAHAKKHYICSRACIELYCLTPILYEGKQSTNYHLVMAEELPKKFHL